MPYPWAGAPGLYDITGANVLWSYPCTYSSMGCPMGKLSCFTDSYMPQGPEVSGIV